MQHGDMLGGLCDTAVSRFTCPWWGYAHGRVHRTRHYHCRIFPL